MANFWNHHYGKEGIMKKLFSTPTVHNSIDEGYRGLWVEILIIRKAGPFLDLPFFKGINININFKAVYI